MSEIVERRLQVFTAPMAYSGHDRFDITAKSGGRAGAPFAPSWTVLSEALRARRAAVEMRAAGRSEVAYATEEEAWRIYVTSFLQEMRASYRIRRPAWDDILRREQVVLVCYCADRNRCHRGLVAEILAKLGAMDAGEIAGAKAAQLLLIG